MNVNSILRQSENCVELFVRVTPNASSDEITGIIAVSDDENRLALKVRAVPEKSKANKAAIRLLAKSMHLPKSSFDVTRGSTSRQKTIRIDGNLKQITKSLKNYCLPDSNT